MASHPVKESTLALLWTKKVNETEYRVSRAGHSVRLYTNGVFHSQYNSLNPFNGALWDCLSLPALMLDQKADARRGPKILVLGVGGGAVIKQLRVLFKSPEITGIEYDATHLDIAKRWFKVDARRTELVHADAQQWLSNYSGDAFDIIIDDLFSEHCGEPVRAIPMTSQWSRLLANNLNPDGMIVANFADRRDMSRAKLIDQKKICDQYRIEHPKYENSIGIFLRQPSSVRHFRKTLAGHPALTALQRRKTLTLSVVNTRKNK